MPERKPEQPRGSKSLFISLFQRESGGCLGRGTGVVFDDRSQGGHRGLRIYHIFLGIVFGVEISRLCIARALKDAATMLAATPSG
jgi:hypothetical protein